MYVGTSKNPKKYMQQICHAYEQEFGDIRGLPERNNFPFIFTKHQ